MFPNAIPTNEVGDFIAGLVVSKQAKSLAASRREALGDQQVGVKDRASIQIDMFSMVEGHGY